MTALPTPAALGTATRAARKQLGLTQPQLALAAGVGVRFVVEMEAGKPTLRLEHVLRVLHALGGELRVEGLPSAPEAVVQKSKVPNAETQAAMQESRATLAARRARTRKQTGD
nr:helix-turn-helix transcriptional regulator [uncultured Albidiferax sp.]